MQYFPSTSTMYYQSGLHWLTIVPSGSVQTFTAPVDGIYQVQCWGADGNNSYWLNTEYPQSRGAGYSVGEVHLTAHTPLYVYVGEAGFASLNMRYAWNGGGFTEAVEAHDAPGVYVHHTGGGATDIRTIATSWDNTSGLQSRIIVAGGEGGGHCASHPGGSGGGLIAGRGYSWLTHSYTMGLGGGQTPYREGRSFTLGIGEFATIQYYSGELNCAGGGGGHYGGLGCHDAVQGSGGGGSSYMSGYPGCAPRSDYTFNNGVLIQGCIDTNNRDTTYNGYAKITLLSID